MLSHINLRAEEEDVSKHSAKTIYQKHNPKKKSLLNNYEKKLKVLLKFKLDSWPFEI